MRVRAALAGLAMLLPAVGRAQDAPATVPGRDVDVVYRMQAGGRVLQQRMRWLTAAQLLRVDPPTPAMYMIVDYRAHRMEVVQDAKREVLDLAGGAVGLPGAPAGAAYARGGADQVAGLACTDWQTRDAAGEPVTVCVTADGVLLRARIAGRTALEAGEVTYAPQDPALFRVPEGYTHVSPGQG